MTRILWPRIGNLRSRAIAWSGGGGGPAPVEPFAFEVFAPMNNLTGYSRVGSLNYSTTLTVGAPIVGSGGAFAVPLEGSPALTIRRSSYSFVGGSVGDPANPARIKPSDVFVIAVDGGRTAGVPDPIQGVVGNVTMSLNPYSPRLDTNMSLQSLGGPTSLGPTFFAVGAERMRDNATWASGLDISNAAPGTYTFDITLTTSPIAQGTLRCGPVYRITQRRKARVVLTYDDWNPEQLTVVQPLMTARGLVGSCYCTTALINAPGKMTTAQGLALRAAGWSINMDCHEQGWPVFAYGSVANAIAAMNTNAALLQSLGLSSLDDTRHVCYSLGPNSYPATADTGLLTSASVTSAGGAVLTLTSGDFWLGGQRPAQGAHVKGTGLIPLPRVVSATDTTVTLDRTVPSGSYTVRFAATVNGGAFGHATAISTGTTKITGIITNAIVPGMVMLGRGVPANTTVVSVDVESNTSSGEITVSNAIPAGMVWCRFVLPDGEWNDGRFTTAAIAAGYRTGRRTKAPGAGFFTQFGLAGDLAYKAMEIDSLDGEPNAGALPGVIANMRRNIYDNRDWLMLSHGNAADMTQHIAIFDFLQARVAAGEIEVQNLTQWHNTVSARPGPP